MLHLQRLQDPGDLVTPVHVLDKEIEHVLLHVRIVRQVSYVDVDKAVNRRDVQFLHDRFNDECERVPTVIMVYQDVVLEQLEANPLLTGLVVRLGEVVLVAAQIVALYDIGRAAQFVVLVEVRYPDAL